MRRPYELTDEADHDLLEIGAYIARNSPDAADRFVDRIHAAFERIAENAMIGRTRDDLSPTLRSFIVGDYIIFYRVDQEKVIVIRVLHGARDIQRIFDV